MNVCSDVIEIKRLLMWVFSIACSSRVGGGGVSGVEILICLLSTLDSALCYREKRV